LIGVSTEQIGCDKRFSNNHLKKFALGCGTTILWYFALLGGGVNIAKGEDSTPPEVTHAFTHNLIGVKPIESKAFNVGVVKPGTKVDAALLISNDTATAITFEKVEVSCKCTTAKVPQVTIVDGESAETSFHFVTPTSPRVVEEHFTANIECNGARNVIRVGFAVRYEGLVAFTRPEFIFPFSAQESEASFRLPLVYESSDLFRDLIVEARDDFATLLRTNVVNYEGKYFVECSFSPSKVTGASAIGEILVRTSSGFKSSILCTLRKQQRVEILPSRLVFTVGELPGQRQATAILRSQSGSSAEKVPVIVSVNCKSPLGVPLETSFVRVSDQIYRIRVESRDVADLGSEGKLTWTIKTDRSDELLVETKCVLSN
jgi:Protein of unknown function (DUF1573)